MEQEFHYNYRFHNITKRYVVDDFIVLIRNSLNFIFQFRCIYLFWFDWNIGIVPAFHCHFLLLFSVSNDSLAKYDQSYDIRDRVRFLRYLVFPSNDQSKLAKYAKKIFLASKPAPVIESSFKGISFLAIQNRMFSYQFDVN